MARLEDLPVELLVQIMCHCDNIKSVLRLSPTCKLAHQLWLDNAFQITGVVFMFERSELMDILALFKLEA